MSKQYFKKRPQSEYSQRAKRNGQQHTASVVGYQQHRAEQAEARRLQAVAEAQRIVRVENERQRRSWLQIIRANLSGIAFGVGVYAVLMSVGWWLMQGTGAVLVRGHYRSAAGQGLTMILVYTAIPVMFALCGIQSVRKRKQRAERARAFLVQQEKIQAFKDSQLQQ